MISISFSYSNHTIHQRWTYRVTATAIIKIIISVEAVCWLNHLISYWFCFCFLITDTAASWEEWWTYDGISGKLLDIFRHKTISNIYYERKLHLFADRNKMKYIWDCKFRGQFIKFVSSSWPNLFTGGDYFFSAVFHASPKNKTEQK